MSHRARPNVSSRLCPAHRGLSRDKAVRTWDSPRSLPSSRTCCTNFKNRTTSGANVIAYGSRDKAAPESADTSRLMPNKVDEARGNIQEVAALMGVEKPEDADFKGAHQAIELEYTKLEEIRKAAIITLLGYFFLGIAACSWVLDDWPVLDSIWFVLTTLTTIGYGDFVPDTPALRAFCVAYILLGTCLVASALGVVLAGLLDGSLVPVPRLRIRARIRASRALRRLVNQGDPHAHQRKLAKAVKMSPTNTAKQVQVFRVVVQELASLMLLLLCSGWEYHKVDPKTFPTLLDGIYFAAVTASTVGYGDIVPCTGKDRVITLVLIPAAVFIFANSARRIADYFISAERQKQEMLMLNKALDLGDVLRMDSDSDGRVSREEYTLFMLTMLGRITPDDISLLHTQFARLDVTKTGYLDCQDLLRLEEQNISGDADSEAIKGGNCEVHRESRK